MNIIPRHENNILIIEIKGRMDSYKAVDFEKTFLPLIQGEKKIIFDCSELKFICSSGLRVIFSAAKQLDLVGGKLLLCSLQESIHEVFRVCGALSILSVYETVTEAVKS